ncbi:unnamed protein product [Natator depressus]
MLPDLMDILYEMPKQATDFGKNSISYQRFLFYERKLAMMVTVLHDASHNLWILEEEGDEQR